MNACAHLWCRLVLVGQNKIDEVFVGEHHCRFRARWIVTRLSSHATAEQSTDHVLGDRYKFSSKQVPESTLMYRLVDSAEGRYG